MSPDEYLVLDGVRKKAVFLGLADDLVSQRLSHGFALGMDLQLFIDFLQVKGNRVGRDAQFCGRCFVTTAFNQQLQQTNLMRCQLVVGFFGRVKISK